MVAALAAAGIPVVTFGEGGAPWSFDGSKPIIPAPEDPAAWPAYRERLAQWRKDTLREIHYDGALYRRPQFAWSASAYACGFIMMCDEDFYRPASGKYTVNALMQQATQAFGGYDSVVLWHAYPRIGVDQRNQYDFYRDMPGGLPGVRDAVQTFQDAGVRVYINYNPWDTGTRREGKSDIKMLAEMVGELKVDGIFLDTMKEGAVTLRQELDAARPGVVLEGEATPPLDRLADHHASWAQWFDDSEVPGVLGLKWLERHHMQHQIKRWNLSHAAELQTAWMNGSGMMIWENVFGSLMLWNASDRSTLRQMLPIQRRYKNVFMSEGWTPLVPCEGSSVYASLWTQRGTRLWTLVNRSASAVVSGPVLRVDDVAGQRYYDLIAGREIQPSREAGTVLLKADLPPGGIGCLLATDAAGTAGLDTFMTSQASVHAASDPGVKHPLRQNELKAVWPTTRYAAPPDGMVAIHAGPRTFLKMEMRVRECGFYDSIGDDEKTLRGSYRYETRQFMRQLLSLSYAIDETPVTNADFDAFMRATAYHPRQTENFLKHWVGGKIPAGKADHPVVWIDMDDARAYAKWSGKRLPTEEEWQYAAEGEQGHEYPWGNGLRAGVCNLGETGDTTPVKAFPSGRSAWGCYDLCGNVWQWTESERSDGRTRFSIIRGGSYFCAQGSGWYVDGGPRPSNFATKFLLMWPGLDRCATVGFRCAVDLQPRIMPS